MEVLEQLEIEKQSEVAGRVQARPPLIESGCEFIGKLEIKGLNAGYGRKAILHQLDIPPFEVGQVTVLTGPNAAGKSTLLRALAGLLEVQGSMKFNGQELVGMSARQRAGIVGFMPQHVPNNINLSVMEAVISALKASPFDAVSGKNNSLHGRALDILERIGITHLALDHLSQLSGGQRQIASLARTVVRDPKILLLDEPTSALDLKHQVKVMKLARSFAMDGRIVIIVLHDLNLALRWADRVIVMDKGKIAGYGNPTESITAQTIAKVYGVHVRIINCPLGQPHMIVDDEMQ
ncbi:MAG TPA: ABC transporter ATP-binding protein [Sphingobacteriaceae bacterium]|nr:ABC transporter ATP-binding protein [Sphingobacteriaceae bacterium]